LEYRLNRSNEKGPPENPSKTRHEIVGQPRDRSSRKFIESPRTDWGEGQNGMGERVTDAYNKTRFGFKKNSEEKKGKKREGCN